jgi:quinol monooxygenase YgiN
LGHLLLAAVAVATQIAVQAVAQPSASPPIVAVAYVDVMPRAGDSMTAALRRYREESLMENGAVGIDLLEQIGRPGHFAVVEVWKDPRAFDAHGAAAPVRRLREAVEPIRLSGYDERVYAALTPSRPQRGTRAGVQVVTHVDIAGGAAGGADLLTRLAEASRDEPGCVRFDILQHTTRPNHFTIVESWRDQRSHDAHAAAPHTKQYRDALQLISGSPLDERLYRMLE